MKRPFDNLPEDTPPPSYTPFLSDLIDHARKQVRKHPQLPPVAFLMREGKVVGPIIAADFPDVDAKDRFAETVRQSASRHKADGIAFISEAWSLEGVDREEFERERAKYAQLADHPNRVDTVMVSLETRAGLWTGLARIEQGEKGRKMGALHWMKCDESQGRFANLLPVVYATPAQVDAFIAQICDKLKAAGINPDYRFEDTGRRIIDPLIQHARQAPADKLTAKTAEVIAASTIAFLKEMGGDFS